MQRKPDTTDEPLISIAEAARRLDVNRSTLLRQIREGVIRSHGKKVRFSEVLADRRNNIDPTRRGRGEGLSAAECAARAAAADATPDATESEATASKPEPDSHADFIARRTAAIAKMRELDLAERVKTLTPVSEVERAAYDAIALMTSAFDRNAVDAAAAAAAKHGWDERKVRIVFKELLRGGLDHFRTELLMRLDQRTRAQMAGDGEAEAGATLQ